jgi:hypothetical protein
MVSDLHIQPLDKAIHHRASFDCGIPVLNDCLAKAAALDMKRKAAGCWVITEEGDRGRHWAITSCLLKQSMPLICLKCRN